MGKPWLHTFQSKGKIGQMLTSNLAAVWTIESIPRDTNFSLQAFESWTTLKFITSKINTCIGLWNGKLQTTCMEALPSSRYPPCSLDFHIRKDHLFPDCKQCTHTVTFYDSPFYYQSNLLRKQK